MPYGQNHKSNFQIDFTRKSKVLSLIKRHSLQDANAYDEFGLMLYHMAFIYRQADSDHDTAGYYLAHLERSGQPEPVQKAYSEARSEEILYV